MYASGSPAAGRYLGGAISRYGIFIRTQCNFGKNHLLASDIASAISGVYMKDYYNLFVELSLQQCTKNDYANKLKVKKSNAAAKKIYKLQDEMMQNISKNALFMLLNHEDDRVKVNAASFCLHASVLIEQSVLTLKRIIADSDDSTICFSAKMLLQEYNN